MKFFLAFAMIVAVASAQAIIKPKYLDGLTDAQIAEVQEILEAIHSPSTDPTTAAMLEQMLVDLLGIAPPQPIIIPGVVDEDHMAPIHIPGIIEDYHPIDISPVIIPNPVVPSSPLVQIIVNVQAEQTVPGEVVVDRPSPVEVVEEEEIVPTPVVVVEESDQVQVVEEPEYELEPVHVAPIHVAPAVVEPESLN